MSRDNKVEENQLSEYLDTIELSGITIGHKKEVARALEKYLESQDYKIDKPKSLKYFKHLKDTCAIAYYRKQMYQIRKFLMHLGHDWVKEIKLPADPIYYPKRISREVIDETLAHFTNQRCYSQLKAITLLGASSGLRAEELYQIALNDLDLDNRTVYVRHNPVNGQSTKTKRNRVSFFSIEAQNALKEYLIQFSEDRYLKTLFSQTHVTRLFKRVPIQVKDLRKYFSQEWDRRGGPTSIKKILMGHSLKKDVDLSHYNYQSEEDLKNIYDRVMS